MARWNAQTSDLTPIPKGRTEEVPPGLSLFVKLIFSLTGLALLALLETGYVGLPTSRARLWSPDFDRFGDFWHYRVLLGSIHTAEFFAASDRFAYPAPCAILYLWLYHFGSHPHVSFNLMLWAIELASAVLLLGAWVRRGVAPYKAASIVALMALSSHPWHMLYDRGNIEVFVYLLVALGCWCWLTGYGTASAFFWGCAGALKLYPLLLLAMYLRRGAWRTFFFGLGTCALILFCSFWFVGPTIAVAASGTIWGLRGFVGTYGAHSRFAELVYDHSILAGLKLISDRLFHAGDQQILLSHVYEALLVLLGPVAYLRWRRGAPEINQMCLLLVCMVSLPPVSYDYTLIHIYLVIGIVFCASLDAERRGKSFAGWRLYAVGFAILCTAETWVEVWWWQPNGLLKAGALITTAVLLVRYPLELFNASSGKPVGVHALPERQAVLVARGS